MDSFYIQTLYPLQDQVICVMQNVRTGFYLTGGTAVSRGYIHHRYSDYLDFFVNDDERFELWGERIIHALDAAKTWRLEVMLRQPRYIRLNLFEATVSLKAEHYLQDLHSLGEQLILKGS